MNKERLSDVATTILVVAEVIISIILIVILFLGIIYLLSQIYGGLQEHIFYLSSKEIHKILDTALVLFIIIELFRITMAYLLGRQVLKSVVEAALVAVGRKIVLYEFATYGLMGAISLAVLTLALIFAYYVVSIKSYGALKEKSS